MMGVLIEFSCVGACHASIKIILGADSVMLAEYWFMAIRCAAVLAYVTGMWFSAISQFDIGRCMMSLSLDTAHLLVQKWLSQAETIESAGK